MPGMTDSSSRMERQSGVIRMHVVDLRSLAESASTVEEALERTRELWSAIYDEMTEMETLWVFAPNGYDEAGCWPVPMAVADYARKETDLVLKNIVTRFQHPIHGRDLESVYEEILFFVKDKRSYRFDKDPVRIAHVYKGKEWGGERETGQSSYHDTEVQRYNPNGKDPGNVWLTEIRDQTPDETVDETQPLRRTEALARCIRAGSEAGETVNLWMTDEEFTETVDKEEREAKVRTSDNYQ